jgi:hypothetical protein
MLQESNITRLHDSLAVIDGLVISKWSRAVFADMRRGGLTAANCTCSIWEGFVDTMRNIAQWKRWFADNADLIAPVRTAADIRRAKAEGKTGIILGFQNTSALEDQIGYMSLFKELGVGVMQLTYNTQNLAGAGCYERRDTGQVRAARAQRATAQQPTAEPARAVPPPARPPAVATVPARSARGAGRQRHRQLAEGLHFDRAPTRNVGAS